MINHRYLPINLQILGQETYTMAFVRITRNAQALLGNIVKGGHA